MDAGKGGLILAASAASESKLFGTEMIRRFNDTALEIQACTDRWKTPNGPLFRKHDRTLSECHRLYHRSGLI